MHRSGVGVLLLLAISAGSVAAAAVVRGAAPEALDRYRPVDGKFTCFDGSKSIDFGQVNDNFCDCPDSSDEPGTSACPNGVFYCRNRGHEPKLLASAFVDDGICDCCDGTDELSGCKNTCIEKNSATRDALKQKISAYKEALDKKAAYAASAAGVRENIKQRHQNVDADIAAAEGEMTRLMEERTRVEAETDEKRAQHKKEQAELAAKRKAEREAQKAEEEKAAAEKAAAEQAAAEQAAADAAAQQAAADAGGEQQEGGEAPPEETDEERGRRIASQWTNDPAAAGAAGEGSPDEAADQPEEVTDGDQDGSDKGWSFSKAWSAAKDRVQKLIAKSDEAEADDVASESEEAAPEDEEPAIADDWGHEEEPPHPDDYDPSAGSDDIGSLQHDPDYQPFDESALQKVRRDLTAAEKKLTDLRAEKERVMRQINYNFNDAWAGLLNKCLESREPQFTYKFCFFDKAVQVDNGGGHETNLGRWKGFEAGGTEAVFDAGDACGQHAPRSLRVKVECDGTERAWSASEPNVCAYVVHASTPAACKQDKLKELESNLDALLAEEAALARELEEEEAQRQRDLADMKARLGVGPGDGHDEL